MENEAENPVQLIACGHTFGAVCIAKWAQTSRTCPLCRAGLKEVEKDFTETPIGQFDYSFRFEAPEVRGLSYTEDSSWYGDAGHDTHGNGYFSSHNDTGYGTNGHSEDETFSWQSYVGHDCDGDSDDEYFDVRRVFDGEDQVQNQPEKDIWLSVTHKRQYPPNTPYFPSFDNEPTNVLCENLFDDLVDLHRQWMIEALADDISKSEVEVGFHNVFPC
jgi:hypothetical protein